MFHSFGYPGGERLVLDGRHSYRREGRSNPIGRSKQETGFIHRLASVIA